MSQRCINGTNSSAAHEGPEFDPVGHTSSQAALEERTRDMAKGKKDLGWRRVVRNFTPSYASDQPYPHLFLNLPLSRWFSVTMGTGIVSVLLQRLPYNGEWLYWISVVIFCLNVTLFLLFSLISVVRYTLYPEIWLAMIRHPVQSLFIGTFPMGLATIINMIVYVLVPAWGDGAVKLAWALWWIDVVISLACCLYMPFVM